jgi:3-oxoadipate enol-lactonase
VPVLANDVRGSGESVLLLHAGLGDRGMWRDDLEWLADAGFRAIAVDLPGFGGSPVKPGRQAPWEDVLETLRDLDVAQAAVVGNSYGAAVALRVAAVAPAAVGRLMLVSPPPLAEEPSPTLSAAWDAESAALERGDLDAAVAAVLDAWLQPQAPAGLRDRLGAMQRRALELQHGVDDVEEAPDPLERHPELLGQLQMPILAVAGEADMPDFRHGAEEIVNRVPHGQMAIIEGAGHFASLEAPDSFRELLLAFLRQPDTRSRRAFSAS